MADEYCMSRHFFLIVIILLLLVPARIYAADAFWLSQFALGGAQAADIASSWGRTESNSLLRSQSGNFNSSGASIKVATVSAMCGIERWLLRKDPQRSRFLTAVNLVAAGTLAGIAARNFGVARAAAPYSP